MKIPNKPKVFVNPDTKETCFSDDICWVHPPSYSEIMNAAQHDLPSKKVYVIGQWLETLLRKHMIPFDDEDFRD